MATPHLVVQYADGGGCGLPVSAQERTAITEQTTSEFRNDLDRLSPADRACAVEALRCSYNLLRDNRRSFFARVHRAPTIQLKGGLSSSLYSLRAGRDIRVIMAIDDDPVFGQILVTLFGVVRHDELERSYRSIANLIYRNWIETNGRAR